MPTVLADDESPDWEERLDRVLARAADDFRVSLDGGEPAWIQACVRYFRDGEHEGFDHGELIDYLGVSTPSVLDRAGYSDAQSLRVMELLPLVDDAASDDGRVA